MLDEALVLWMPAPASFTGEDSAELHLHGGPGIVAGVLDALTALGPRLAEPGEFTRRAFENGRLDLAQAEAIGDLVDAESGAQRRQALAQLGGALSRRYEAWREALLDALALLEAEIDFPDEDVPPEVGGRALSGLETVLEQVRAAVADARGEKVRDGIRIALVGAPNVGKSSLLNALTKRDAAIVTPIAGTTRDVIEVATSLNGQLVVFADTAGLRDTEDEIEAEGVRRAHAWSDAADVRIGVADQTRPETVDDALAMLRPGDILALNKSDLARQLSGQVQRDHAVETWVGPGGLEQLLESLTTWMGTTVEEREFPAVTRTRHRLLLAEAGDHLARALEDHGRGPELAAENVRLALRSLEKVTGRTNPEAVLDRVFASFCIGK